jgi:predicted permease
MTAFRTLRIACRNLLRRPGFSAITILTYAMGIGACTAVFSIFDTMRLRPLPFGPNAARLVTLHSTHPTQATDWDDSNLSPPDLVDLAAGSRTLERIEALFDRNFVLSAADATDRIQGASVTPGLFPMIGAEPALGRGFRAEEAAEPGFEPVALVSWGLWQSRLGGDPKAIGRPIRINGRELTLVGVMPPGFRFPEREDLWVPYRANEQAARTRRFLFPIGLRREGTTLSEVEAELSTLARHLGEAHPVTNRGWGVKVFPIRDFLVDPGARVLSGTLLAAVLLVLAVGGANVAGLLFARAADRRREVAIRSSLGAGRSRLVAEMLAENLLLAGAGALLGWFLAGLGVEALARSSSDLPYWMQVAPDARVAVFTIILMAAVGVTVGIAPALRASAGDLTPDLKSHASGATEAVGAQRAQGLLVAGQVAASLALLVAAQLLIRHYLSLQSADAGFDDSRLLTMRLYLPGDRYDPVATKAAFFRQALDRVAALPGVEAASASSAIPIDDGGGAARAVVEGRPVAPGEELGITVLAVTNGFHATLGLTLAAGRPFTAREEEADGPPAAILGQGLARRLFPEGGAVGRRIGLVGERETTWFPVVGVAPDVQFEEFGESTSTSALNLFLPYGQRGYRTMALLARTGGDPGAAAGAVRAALRDTDPDVALYEVRTMGEVRKATTWGERFFGRTLGAFAAVALFLAALGVWGSVAHAVARRKREIGIRMALGARPEQVVSLLAGRAIRAAAAGLALGLLLSLGAAMALRGLLFQVPAFQALPFAAMGLLLLGVVGLASFLPARRAARLDPATVLRSE